MSAISVSPHGPTAVLTLDLPDEPVNKLNSAVKTELEVAFEEIRGNSAYNSVVIRSGKPDTFIAGADIEEFTKLSTREEFERLSREGQEMLQRVADFPKPVVVAINGACLGGGLELALAGHYRIATDHPKTELSLPEVRLGLLPGAGGCERLPRLIGLRAALEMILSSRGKRGSQALRLGLVDEVVPPSILLDIALQAAARLATNGLPKREPPGGFMAWLLEKNPLGRKLVYAISRRGIEKETRGNYPAPFAALEVVKTGMEEGAAAGYEMEHRKFGELAVTDVSRKLVQIFFATNALKKDAGIPPGSAQPRPVKRLGVIGSGFMGSGIAGTAVTTAGVDVRLRDTDLTRVGKGLKAAGDILNNRLKRRRISRFEYQRLSALLSGGADYSGFGLIDLVVEAVFEDLELKRRVLMETEAATPTTAVFATNTSTIPISEIAAEAARPDRVIGMHFFSPVDRMPLLEIIPTEQTSAETIVTAVQFGRKLGKTVIVVRDRPGFWVNRILTPYMNEAGFLLREGVPMDVIDRLMTRFGFPVGPFTLLDEVGIDVGAKAGEVMHRAFGERMIPSGVVEPMIKAERYGRKNGRGFYHYHNNLRTGPDEAAYDLLGIRPVKPHDTGQIEQRLVYIMLNEAAMAAGEGVVRSPRDGDIGAIFGFGYPPFRGGPLRYIDDLGAANVVNVLRQLEGQYGARFNPVPTLVELAEQGGRFYPA